jgi:hypothetical protein
LGRLRWYWGFNIIDARIVAELLAGHTNLITPYIDHHTQESSPSPTSSSITAQIAKQFNEQSYSCAKAKWLAGMLSMTV